MRIRQNRLPFFMTTISVNNKRIAKNTLLLYVRMFVMMLVSLYTSRVVLNALGVEDFGIYNIVGGVVVMMGVFNSSMSAATLRFITYELGRGDEIRLKQMFSITMTIYILYALAFVLVAEIVGLWLLNTHLTIPENRMAAANWVFQFSIISAVASILYNPYNAVIIAHEKMDVYAYISLLETFLKLGVAFLMLAFEENRLFCYGLFIMLSSLLVTLAYTVYCVKHYKEASYTFYWDGEKFKRVLSFSGWNMFGAVANLAKGQGLNILLNIFFNPSVNAARGIAYQVNNVVTQFFNNFYTAVRPQIVKYYAQNDIDSMLKLVFSSSRMLFFLMLIISLPVLLETPFIIQAWLGHTPEYVIPFTRLIILITAIDGMSQPIMTTVQATGKIKYYQIAVGVSILMILPISYVLLKNGCSAVSVFYTSLAVSFFCYFLRLVIIKKLIKFPIMNYIHDVFLRCSLCGVLSLIIPAWLSYKMNDNFISFFLISFTCLLSCIIIIWFIGIKKEEKTLFLQFFRRKLKTILNK